MPLTTTTSTITPSQTSTLMTSTIPGTVTSTIHQSSNKDDTTSLAATTSILPTTPTSNDCLDDLPPDHLIYLATQTQQSIKELTTFLDNIRTRLTNFRDLGIIDDKLSTDYGSATLVTRTSWTYSEAVKQLQELEQLNDIATKKTSASWTIRAPKPQA